MLKEFKRTIVEMCTVDVPDGTENPIGYVDNMDIDWDIEELETVEVKKEDELMDIKTIESKEMKSEFSGRTYQVIRLTPEDNAFVTDGNVLKLFKNTENEEVLLDEYERELAYQNALDMFEDLYQNGEIADSYDYETKIKSMVYDDLDIWTEENIQKNLLELFKIEDQYELVAVEISRIREVKETKTVYIAVKKGFGGDATDEAENYINNSYCDNGNDWEEYDDFYNSSDWEVEVEDSSIDDTDTLEELESYDITEILN